LILKSDEVHEAMKITEESQLGAVPVVGDEARSPRKDFYSTMSTPKDIYQSIQRLKSVWCLQVSHQQVDRKLLVQLYQEIRHFSEITEMIRATPVK